MTDLQRAKGELRRMKDKVKEMKQQKLHEPCRMARHILTRHPEKVEEWIREGSQHEMLDKHKTRMQRIRKNHMPNM